MFQSLAWFNPAPAPALPPPPTPGHSFSLVLCSIRWSGHGDRLVSPDQSGHFLLCLHLGGLSLEIPRTPSFTACGLCLRRKGVPDELYCAADPGPSRVSHPLMTTFVFTVELVTLESGLHKSSLLLLCWSKKSFAGFPAHKRLSRYLRISNTLMDVSHWF